MRTATASNAWAANRQALLDRYRRARARTKAIFDMVPPEDRLSRPIPLRHPIIFYEGHIPVFYVNTILGKGLGRPGIDPALERLFARGIDPEDEAAAAKRSISAWPARNVLEDYISRADRAIEDVLQSDELVRASSPAMAAGEAVFTGLEHEAMHQETLLYILHRLPRGTLAPSPSSGPFTERDPRGSWQGESLGSPASALFSPVRIPAGPARLGTDRSRADFGWDNEFDPHEVEVEAFAIDVHDVTNREFLTFVQAGGYEATAPWWTADDRAWLSRERIEHPAFWHRRDDRWFYRGFFEDFALPLSWPVYVTHAEASAYARWKRGRLPTEAEYQRAAFTTPDGHHRSYPWGNEPPDATRGNFDFARCDPAAVGSWPAGASAWGIHDLVGNGWEWTSTIFAPFPGFEPMPSYPEYSADFFDGQHYVMKGASPATARELLRPGLRNWFRPQYPYVYATFRLAWDD